MDISKRQLEILLAIIDDYIKTAVPVGSRTVSRKYMPDLSSATIRNEMSDLEEMGLLMQPHTSAGRIPSHRAYRVYVNEMLSGNLLSQYETYAVEDFMRESGELEQIVRNAAHIINLMTHHTAMALTPQLRRTTLKRIRIIPVAKGLALVVIITDAAKVKQSFIKVPDELSEELMEKLSKLMTDRFAGQAINDIDLSLLEGMDEELRKQKELLESVSKCLSDIIVKSDTAEVILEGTTSIFDYPEYKDMEKARAFLALMESREWIYRLLSAGTNRGLTVLIGDEHNIDALEGMSVVTSTYRVGSRPVGCIGVIGPMRMEYNKVVNVLDQIGRGLSRVMTEYINE